LTEPARVLAADGLDVAVGLDSGPVALWDRHWRGNSAPYEARVAGLAQKPDADVVVINRPARAHWTELIPYLQAAGVRVVVDVDDDFAAIDRGNVALRDYTTSHVKACGLNCPRDHARVNRDWILRACLLADLVTCSTPDLARRYAPHGRFAVLPNLVPARYLDVEASDPWERSIGWSGSVETHPGDLEATGRSVGDVLASHDGWSAGVIGTGKGAAKALGIDEVRATGKWLSLEQYPQAMARLGVGIVPLQASRFNRSKSALKMSEFAALGVPVVASPTPDNKRLHGLGVGLIAANPREWREHLTRLVESEDFRTDLAHRGREAMRAQTYERRAGMWADAWTSTLERRAVA
jgi:hypothetical protein